ncbi:MAG: type II secretion system GspH family protein [Lentisphaeraceae bacterium]|nr:type II secretion system GspH family protein [Lentisphaeraceae bacterium]
MKKYFTLIELLVVIATVGILMTILLPSLTKSREISKTAVCLSQLKQLSLAYNLYTGSNNHKTICKLPLF